MITKKTLRKFLISRFQNDYQKCYITMKFKYQSYFKAIFEHTSYLPFNVTFKERIYHILFMLEKKPLCKLCLKFSVFKDLNKGYSLYCNLCYRKDPLFKQKIKQSNTQTYNLQKEEIINKIEQTNLQRYGIKDPNQLQWMKDNIKKTNLQKYGVEYNQQNKNIRRKTEQTNLRKRGVKHSFEAEDIKHKIKQTNLQKYNVEYVFQNLSIREKAKNTIIQKYGVDNVSKIKKLMDKIQNINRKSFLKRFDLILKKMKFELIDDIYKDNTTNHKWKCLSCNKLFIENWRNMCRGYRCPICFPRRSTSIPEQQIIEFISTLHLDTQINVRNIITPKELDIYIPSKQIAIEHNGLWWHSEEAGCNNNYHLAKTEFCASLGIHLIHIFEDEWIFKRDIVKYRLKQILNINNSERIHARKCKIKEIDPKTKNEFLEKYHIQGRDSSTIKLGAFYNDKLVSVMTFSKGNIAKGSKPREGVWELNRFCSDYNYHIPGIASKLLTYFKRNYKWKEIFSYADRRWSNGNLYYKLDFELDHITQPNYWYVKNYRRIHRFNLKKKPDEPKNISESKLIDIVPESVKLLNSYLTVIGVDQK